MAASVRRAPDEKPDRASGKKTITPGPSRASRIYITGASCSGVTSLGRALAERLDLAHVDVDDFGWRRATPCFPLDRRTCIDLIRRSLPSNDWVLTGPIEGWGDELLAEVDLIGFVVTPTQIRLQRFLVRDSKCRGARIEADGDLHDMHMETYQWAARYDDATFWGPNRLRHEEWLLSRRSSVVRLEGTLPLHDAVDRLLIGLHGDG